MSETQRLSELFADEYLDKIFYFCLRKCGDPHDAEDLASEISLCVLSELDKGTVPDAFSAWVWQIARNRYARFVKRRQSDRDRLTSLPCPESGEELLCDGGDFAQEIAEKDAAAQILSRMREALAFIRQDYRQILVAYYIEDRPIREIAERLGISEGTVKNRLFRSRIRLKEGISMAREFGKRSYNPEAIRYVNVCQRPGQTGQPWVLMNPKLHQNIFLACYDNPMRAEELAIELGVALPYMEDILENLTGQTLLIKEKKRYETAFPIIGRQTQEKIHAYYAKILPGLTAGIEEYIDRVAEMFEMANVSYFGEDQSYDEAKWMLLMRGFSELYSLCENSPSERLGWTERPDQGRWDVVGFEETDFSPGSVGCHGQTDHFVQYKFDYREIWRNTPANLSPKETSVLLEMVEGSEISDRAVADRLVEYGYAARDGESYRSRVAVLRAGAMEAFAKFWQERSEDSDTERQSELLALYRQIEEQIFEINGAIRGILSDDLPARLRRSAVSEGLLASLCTNNPTPGYILKQAVEDGWLKYDEHLPPAVGAYFNLP